MPNLTIFFQAEKMPPEAYLSELTEECTRLCTDVLRAALDAFTARLDAAIKRHTGLTARIRCFGYSPPAIYARN
ncbi:hypothetical protein D3C78_1740080 [compost metagenome]